MFSEINDFYYVICLEIDFDFQIISLRKIKKNISVREQWCSCFKRTNLTPLKVEIGFTNSSFIEFCRAINERISNKFASDIE